MSTEVSSRVTKVGTLTLHRADKAETFVCAQCTREKTSKLSADWETQGGEKKKVCNGCYGTILSKES
jgi:hypothetical protein